MDSNPLLSTPLTESPLFSQFSYLLNKMGAAAKEVRLLPKAGLLRPEILSRYQFSAENVARLRDWGDWRLISERSPNLPISHPLPKFSRLTKRLSRSTIG